MANNTSLSSLSDEQLLALEQQISGSQSSGQDLSTLSDEQLLALESQTQQQGLPDKASEDQFLDIKERFKGGFRSPKDLENVREGQRAERGLAPGTALEPTGFNFRNLLDLPADIADMIGPAFPVVGAVTGSLAGGGVTGGVGAIAAGAAGAGTLEAVRQQIGDSVFGFDQGSATDRAGRVLMESGFALLGEAAGQGLNVALKATKSGLIKAANTLLKKKGLDSFMKHFGKLARNADGNVIKFSLADLRAGNKATLSNSFSDEKFVGKFFNKLFGHGDDFTKKMSKLGKPAKSRGEFRDLYARLFGLQDDVFDTVVTSGASKVNQASNPSFLKNLAKRIDKQLPKTFKTLGDDLTKARDAIVGRADKVAGIEDLVGKSLSQVNTSLADDLVKVQMLIPEGGGTFSFNQDFIRTPTGKSQFNIFKNFMADFFGTADDFSQAKLQSLVNAGEVSVDDLFKISGGKKILLTPNKQSTFKSFSNNLKKLDIQISGAEFGSVKDLSPSLAKYIKGLRGVTTQVADQLGDTRLSSLTKGYSQLVDTVKDIRGKDVGGIEQALRKFSNSKVGTQALEDNQALNSFIKNNFDVDVNKQLSLFKANQTLKEFNRTFGTEKGQQALTGIMKDAFSETNANVLGRLEGSVDKFLPADFKIALNSRRHTAARAITKDAESLLKARFLSNALLAGTGFAAGGPLGAAGTVGVGLTLQRPEVLKALLSGASKVGGKTIPQTAAKQLPRGASQMLAQLLKTGNNNTQ